MNIQSISRSLIVVPVLSLASLAACATPDAASQSTLTDPGTSQQPVVESTCGGIANLGCPVGQECFVLDADRNIPDATGTCRDATPAGGSGAGQTCGGIAALACPAGLTCVVADADKKIPDASGTCR